RGVPDFALRRDRDAVGTNAPRGIEHFHGARLRVEAAVIAGLAGEPVDSASVEHAGVEVGVSNFFVQAEQRDAMIRWLDAVDRILSALGHPWCAVGAERDAVGARAFAKTDQFE